MSCLFCSDQEAKPGHNPVCDALSNLADRIAELELKKSRRGAARGKPVKEDLDE